MSVGQNVPRKDSAAKVAGVAQYVDDLTLPDLWHGATVRSTQAYARIVGIELPSALEHIPHVVAGPKDIPGRNLVALIVDDQPLLADGLVRHVGEPILLLAGPDREQIRALASQVVVHYAPLAPVLTLAQAVEQGSAPDCLHPKDILIQKGNLDAGFAEADLILEGTYEVGHQEQLYIEPNGFMAWWEEGKLVVQGSHQCPYYVHSALKVAFALPGDKVRVLATTTGGGFGGKEDFPSVIAGHAALLALKAGRPVKLIYDRKEDFACTTKRHPARQQYKIGIKKDGTFTACQCSFDLDSGAYVTLSPVVLSRGSIHSTGPYRFPAVEVRGRSFATHTPPNGAFRGFGAPQAYFGLERHIDRMAAALHLDPADVRAKNVLQLGDETGTGQVLKESVSAKQVLEETRKRSQWEILRARRTSTHDGCSGVGMALYMHGVGFTGSGERKMRSLVGLSFERDGRVVIHTSSTDIGQGTATVFPQITCGVLGVPFDRVSLAPWDTDIVPDSGPTVASRTVTIVGRVVELIARELRTRIMDAVARWYGGSPDEYDLRGEFLQRTWSREPLLRLEHLAARLIDEEGPIRLERGYELDPSITWDEVAYKGDAYPSYSYGCTVIEVRVDPDTLTVAITRVVAVHDIGTLIHPVLAAGQIEGGLAQAIGYGMMEEVKWKEGHMLNPSFTNYIMPTTLDLPDMEVSFLENPYSRGPFGAKGVGELPMNGAAPAIANAVMHAIGADVRQLPVTPERILAALQPEAHVR